MTGGAFGSLVAQWLQLTDAERTTLLVAGAAAGMSATFAAPLAAILLAVELLLFEWRPRSLVPVAVASVTAERCGSGGSARGRCFPSICRRTSTRAIAADCRSAGDACGLCGGGAEPHDVRA